MKTKSAESYWRWDADDLLTVYALVEDSLAYVGISKNSEDRVKGYDHRSRRGHRTLIRLETGIMPTEGFERETAWHDRMREYGFTLDSRTWSDVCVEAGKIAGVQTGKKNLSKWWADQPIEYKREKALKASMASAKAGKSDRGGYAAARKRAICDVCDKESSVSGMIRHQRSRKHEGMKRYDREGS